MDNDTLEFQEIYETYYPRIYRYLTRLLGKYYSEDVAQEVFTKIAFKLGEFKGESRLSTWVYRIATNAALDLVRSSGFRKQEPITIAPDNSNNRLNVSSSIEQQLIRQEMNQCIYSLIDNLPPNYRMVLFLSEFEGLKNSEIAEILNLSLDNVKIRLHRARSKLKKEMIIHCEFYRDERNELACEQKREN